VLSCPYADVATGTSHSGKSNLVFSIPLRHLRFLLHKIISSYSTCNNFLELPGFGLYLLLPLNVFNFKMQITEHHGAKSSMWIPLVKKFLVMETKDLSSTSHHWITF
jgi:hypothetical protein